jgi:hypothetical protein
MIIIIIIVIVVDSNNKDSEQNLILKQMDKAGRMQVRYNLCR